MDFDVAKKMKKLATPALLIVIAVALIVGLSVRRRAVSERIVDAGIESQTNLRTLREEEGDIGRLRRERFRKQEEEERLAALDLAGRIVEKQSLATSGNMSLVGDKERFPSALISDAAGMNSKQLRVLVRELGENPGITGPNRASLVTSVTDSWLKKNEERGTQALKEVLEIIDEVLPTLPRGFDTLPVSCAMGRSLEWDLPGWTDFLETHWSRWSGPHGNSNAEVMRRDLLRALDDPQLRIRVERLPQAGGGN